MRKTPPVVSLGAAIASLALFVSTATAAPPPAWQVPAFPSALAVKGPSVDIKALTAAAAGSPFEGQVTAALKIERDRKATIQMKRKAWCAPQKSAARMPKPLIPLLGEACSAATARVNAAADRKVAFHTGHGLLAQVKGNSEKVVGGKAFLAAFKEFKKHALYQDVRAAVGAWSRAKPYELASARDAAEQACDNADGLMCVVAGVLLEDTSHVRQAHATQALKRYQQACTIGEDLGCVHQALFLLRTPTKNDAAAKQLLTSACARRYGPACHHLGLLERFGIGGARSYERAKTAFVKGCSGGSSEACASLALTHLKARRPDTASAKSLYQRACATGSARGCAGLAFMTEFGLGTKKSASTALKGYLKSCTAGWGVACDNAAKMFTRGIGTRANATKAVVLSSRGCMLGWGGSCVKVANALRSGAAPFKQPKPKLASLVFEHACDDGHGTACVELGRAYEQGVGGRAKHGEAMALYQSACKGVNSGFSRYKRPQTPQGQAVPVAWAKAKLVAKSAVRMDDGQGCVELARIYNAGIGVRRDAKRALSIVETACKRGAAAACGQWGEYHLKGTVGDVDHKSAVTAFDRGCQLKHWASCSRLGFLYRMGLGVPKDGAKGMPFLQRACDNGYVAACAQIGTVYMIGNGVPKDLKRGMRLYNKACSGGHALACANLGFNHLAGVGARKSATTALRFFEKGCKLKNRMSCTQRDRLRANK